MTLETKLKILDKAEIIETPYRTAIIRLSEVRNSFAHIDFFKIEESEGTEFVKYVAKYLKKLSYADPNNNADKMLSSIAQNGWEFAVTNAVSELMRLTSNIFFNENHKYERIE